MIRVIVGVFLLFLVTLISANELIEAGSEKVHTVVNTTLTDSVNSSEIDTVNSATVDTKIFFTINWSNSSVDSSKTDTVNKDVVENNFLSNKLLNKKNTVDKKDKLKSFLGEKLSLGISLLGGFAIGGNNLIDLTANYSAQILLYDNYELYLVVGHGLGFDSYEKYRAGISYYIGNNTGFRLGLSAEGGPIEMVRRGSSRDYAFALFGGRLTGGYRFNNHIFADVYATMSINYDIINEAGIRVGYYF